MTRRALIGHTGFVGGNLAAQAPFDDGYNSRNIEEIAGKRYDLVVCAGAPAVKWKANQEPEADRAAIARLESALGAAAIAELVLVSTVDVYPAPVGVDESTRIDPAAGQPYGRHRLGLERFLAGRFKTTIVRLPGLFGPGLKKNVIYDFLHGNAVDRIDAASVFQFYDLADLWKDIEKVRGARLDVCNFATEPTSVATVAKAAFGLDFAGKGPGAPAHYDFRTRHAALWGRTDGRIRGAAEVLAALRDFVRAERERIART